MANVLMSFFVQGCLAIAWLPEVPGVRLLDVLFSIDF